MLAVNSLEKSDGKPIGVPVGAGAVVGVKVEAKGVKAALMLLLLLTCELAEEVEVEAEDGEGKPRMSTLLDVGTPVEEAPAGVKVMTPVLMLMIAGEDPEETELVPVGIVALEVGMQFPPARKEVETEVTVEVTVTVTAPDATGAEGVMVGRELDVVTGMMGVLVIAAEETGNAALLKEGFARVAEGVEELTDVMEEVGIIEAEDVTGVAEDSTLGD